MSDEAKIHEFSLSAAIEVLNVVKFMGSSQPEPVSRMHRRFLYFGHYRHFDGNVKINLTESPKDYGSITKESRLFAHSQQKKMSISR